MTLITNNLIQFSDQRQHSSQKFLQLLRPKLAEFSVNIWEACGGFELDRIGHESAEGCVSMRLSRRGQWLVSGKTVREATLTSARGSRRACGGMTSRVEKRTDGRLRDAGVCRRAVELSSDERLRVQVMPASRCRLSVRCRSEVSLSDSRLLGVGLCPRTSTYSTRDVTYVARVLLLERYKYKPLCFLLQQQHRLYSHSDIPQQLSFNPNHPITPKK